MQLTRIGNIEEASENVDLDQIEREMESQLEDDAVDVGPTQEAQPSAPAKKQAPPTIETPASKQANAFIIANGRGPSKFVPQATVRMVRSNFWPGQSMIAVRNDPAERKRDPFATPLVNPVAPSALLDSKFDKRLRHLPANDSKPKAKDKNDPAETSEPSTPKSSRSRFARATVEALLSIGALPMQMLIEIGRFRQAKENRFFSLSRLESGLAQGDAAAERFAAANPNLVKKKEPAPPSLGMK